MSGTSNTLWKTCRCKRRDWDQYMLKKPWHHSQPVAHVWIWSLKYVDYLKNFWPCFSVSEHCLILADGFCQRRPHILCKKPSSRIIGSWKKAAPLKVFTFLISFTCWFNLSPLHFHFSITPRWMNILCRRSAAQNRGHAVHINATISPSDGSSGARATLQRSYAVSWSHKSTISSLHRVMREFNQVCDYRLRSCCQQSHRLLNERWLMELDRVQTFSSSLYIDIQPLTLFSDSLLSNTDDDLTSRSDSA